MEETMSVKKWSVLLAIMLISSMILTACPAPAPQEPQVIIQTQVVEKEKIVEKPVEKIVEKPVEKVVEKVITPTPGPAAKKLRVNLGTYPDIIDPQKSSFVNEIAHLKLVYEGLTKLDKDLKTIPAAAEKWQYNADATQLTFTLRKDLKYSDGSILNAQRFVFAIMRNIDPATAGEYAQITDEIKGAPDWRGFAADPKKSAADNAKAEADAKAALAQSIKAMHADGTACVGAKPADLYKDAACNTLQLTFSQPAPYFHTVMSLWVTYPAKEENIVAGHENWWNSSKYQIGNGPYVLKNLEPFVRGFFTPNPNYWAGKGKVDIEFSYINDTAVSFEAFKNNEFDIIFPGAEDFAVIQADANLKAQHIVYPGSCTYAIMFHQLKEPFTDPKVRQAFAQALDREAWVKDVLRGLGSPTLTLDPQGLPRLRCEREALGLRRGCGQEGAVRVQVRQRGQAAAHQGDLRRYPAQPHAL
jgi:oligopeptide transport system substrate-binding protein